MKHLLNVEITFSNKRFVAFRFSSQVRLQSVTYLNFAFGMHYSLF